MPRNAGGRPSPRAAWVERNISFDVPYLSAKTESGYTLVHPQRKRLSSAYTKSQFPGQLRLARAPHAIAPSMVR